MSVLAHLVPGWHPEDAATRALAYILDPHASPGMAQVFVEMLGRTGIPAFPPGRVEHDPDQRSDSGPDLTISDAKGKRRIFVEAMFWEGLEYSQPFRRLEELPDDAPSAVVFIAPGERVPGLWGELRARCENGPGIGLEERMSSDSRVAWARAGRRVLLVAAWNYVLDALRRGAEDAGVEQDIVQLRGLADRMEAEAFLPLDASEVADVGLARRIAGYCGLVDKITDRIVADGIARLKKVNWNAGSYQRGRLVNRSMRIHGKFDLRFGMECRAWRDSGVTPLWWVLSSSAGYDATGDWQRIKGSLDGVRSYGGSLYIPVRLKPGVEEAEVIEDAIRQMRRVADMLLEVSRRA